MILEYAPYRNESELPNDPNSMAINDYPRRTTVGG